MSLIKECQGNTYYSFSNWEGKKWTIPVNNSKVALCLYEPSGIKGKMLKKFFNISQKMGVINKLLKGDYVNIDISQNLQNILINSFGEDLDYFGEHLVLIRRLQSKSIEEKLYLDIVKLDTAKEQNNYLNMRKEY